ncbi:hypothetical protein LY78DRAFT_683580 [Colletotrichum sublineola]|nr:hypothetical protein LY78DRAFT_683580 [Colletotrichum sublineola]
MPPKPGHLKKPCYLNTAVAGQIEEEVLEHRMVTLSDGVEAIARDKPHHL